MTKVALKIGYATWNSNLESYSLFSLPWGKTVPSLEQAVLSRVQCSFLTKQTFLFKSGFSQSSTSLIKETRAKELQLCWLGAIINSKCLCCLFLSGQHQLTSKLLSQKYKYRIKRTQKSVRYFNNHFLTTNCFFRNIEVQIKNVTQKITKCLIY